MLVVFNIKNRSTIFNNYSIVTLCVIEKNIVSSVIALGIKICRQFDNTVFISLDVMPNLCFNYCFFGRVS